MSLDAPQGHIGFTLNGAEITVPADPAMRLSEMLRETAGARDVKVGCNAGDCGACTVLLDGEPVCACMMASGQVQGRTVETQAGLVADDLLAERLAQSFQRHQAAQCGICTPGMMVSAVALLRSGAKLTEESVADALGGVLCRCTGYRKIIAAVLDASDTAPLAEGGVGAPVARLDGWPKVAGTERFGDDVAPADALVVRVIRSPYHRAGFRFGDLETFMEENALALVLTAMDVPGENRFGVIPGFEDQPVFAVDEARFKGEAVAAVVGTPEALDGMDPFPVTWEERTAALTPEGAAEAGDLHPDRAGNVMCRGRVARGSAAEALAEAAHVVSGDFSTGFIEHGYIEPEAASARRVGDRIEVQCCTQAPYMNRDGLATILGLAPEAVRILPTATGGGFGSKLDLTAQPYVALAAWHLNRPVRITYTRAESIASSTKRHPSEVHMEIGADAEGRIVGARFDGIFNTGAYASWGPTVANRVPIHASGPYLTPNYEANSAGIHTNTAPAGAFRGFGVPQSAVAQEQLYDMLAEALGLDRLEFRRRNCLTNGAPTVTGQVFETGMGIDACFDALEPHWTRALADCAAFNAESMGIRRGVGIAAGWYGCGNTSISNPSTIRAGVTPDGELRLHQGAVDIGQGANTVIAQIFAEALGVPVSQITLVGPDTDITPDAGKTSASRQTYITGNAARLCGEALRAQILRLGNVSDAARISFEEGGIALSDAGTTVRVELDPGEGYALEAVESYDPPTTPLDENGQGDPYAVFGTAAQMCELEVDMALGTVKLLRIVAAHDVGRAINPLLVEGQIEGGVAQGIGLALMEEFLPGRTENLHDYLIPTIGDVPAIESLIIESGDAHGPYGAKGLGEHCLIPTAPAILNAIAHATGARIHHLPATPDRVRAAILSTGA
ncbi:MAG: aldehyde oxidase [Rhodobacteraceae bacterium]|jgi:aldehyde oxidoreductase|uniref:Aerobic-type carbon monoxide dehydrogenase, large subunit CoxL/CutL-like protein n=1 Tax=Salipiger profundus TaxID=1229727 RepID=A0A1U7D7P4_9RHOB|nr:MULTISPECIES: molybdopterin cofactor-binding domain-containing protein [Salipiger]APX24181.1 aerobic-type carbon monoxide dehydrogenase, large subunit CoxL/CutL-like protein [Salipiger profundus]MAB07371.1 aldehyde oxidase [Paracoccaceae bacterium]GFZ95223.1 aldehyde oxidase [Salipiger profundus]SFB88619.1 CO or xanthine dehydrogenase, Mo-binding subunit [Salipiger profundus]